MSHVLRYWVSRVQVLPFLEVGAIVVSDEPSLRLRTSAAEPSTAGQADEGDQE